MQVLVLNSGSSSIKFKVFMMPEANILCSGLIERIGFDDSKFTFNSSSDKLETITSILSHNQGLTLLAKQLLDKNTGVINSPNDIEIVGHRVVHGGQYFKSTTEVTKKVKVKIEELSTLAPLHNPHNLEGINVAETIFPQAKQIAVFDTAFHQSIPEVAYKYAIPNSLLEEHNIRLYGFHGTSHKYVSEKAIEYLKKLKS